MFAFDEKPGHRGCLVINAMISRAAFITFFLSVIFIHCHAAHTTYIHVDPVTLSLVRLL